MADTGKRRRPRLVEQLPAACLGALAAWVLGKRWSTGQHSSSGLQATITRLQGELQHANDKRAADRAGRIRAEQELRKAQLALQQSAAQGDSAVPTQGDVPVFPFRPIGTIRSCFSQRNGTPRQPQLVPAARCIVRLSPDISDACLQGLEQYSHVWLLYVFHQNTDLAKCLSANRGQGIKAKIRVPRLDGGRMGVLATRSPHRPAPIGLSVARVLGVQGRELTLGGADLVNGSPILDIKPYVPFCDSLPEATAPSWVMAEADDEPLRVGGLCMEPSVRQQLASCWTRVPRATRCLACADDFQALIEQVLSRDIRSVHQRLHRPAAVDPGGIAEGQQAASAGVQQGVYHVVLDGVDVSYDIDQQGQVLVRGAELWRQQELEEVQQEWEADTEES